MKFTKMSAEELRLAKMWYEEDDMTPSEIADLLRRHKSTITRHVVKGLIQKRDGRPRMLSEADVDALEALLGGGGVDMISRCLLRLCIVDSS